MSEDIEAVSHSDLPAALDGLRENKETMQKISQYCRTPSSDFEALFKQTQEYTLNAITNLAYHVHTVGTHLTNFLKLQSSELEKLEVQISAVGDRMRVSRDWAAQSAFRTAPKGTLITGVKSTKIATPSVPTPLEWARKPITVESISQLAWNAVPLGADAAPHVLSPSPQPLSAASSVSSVTSEKRDKKKKGSKTERAKHNNNNNNATPDPSPRMTSSLSGSYVPPPPSDLPPPPPPPTSAPPPPPVPNYYEPEPEQYDAGADEHDDVGSLPPPPPPPEDGLEAW
jgi:hypothetical protein